MNRAESRCRASLRLATGLFDPMSGSAGCGRGCGWRHPGGSEQQQLLRLLRRGKYIRVPAGARLLQNGVSLQASLSWVMPVPLSIHSNHDPTAQGVTSLPLRASSLLPPRSSSLEPPYGQVRPCLCQFHLEVTGLAQPLRGRVTSQPAVVMSVMPLASQTHRAVRSKAPSSSPDLATGV